MSSREANSPSSSLKRSPSSPCSAAPMKRARLSSPTVGMGIDCQPGRTGRCDALTRVFNITELAEKIFLHCDEVSLITSAVRVRKQWHYIIQTSTPIQQYLFFEPVHVAASDNKPKVRRNKLLKRHFQEFFVKAEVTRPYAAGQHGALSFCDMFGVSKPLLQQVPNPSLSSPSSTNTKQEKDKYKYKGAVSKGHNWVSSTSGMSGPGAGEGNPTGRSWRHWLDRWNTTASWDPDENHLFDRYLRKDASWRRMLVRQPPIERMGYAERMLEEIISYSDSEASYYYFKGGLKFPVSAKSELASDLPMSVTTPATVSMGGLRMGTMYDVVQLNFSRTMFRTEDPGIYLASKFQVYWDHPPHKRACPDDKLRKAIKKHFKTGPSNTLVIGIMAAEMSQIAARIMGMTGIVASAEAALTKSWGSRFRCEDAEGDPDYVHGRGPKGRVSVTGPPWLTKKRYDEKRYQTQRRLDDRDSPPLDDFADIPDEMDVMYGSGHMQGFPWPQADENDDYDGDDGYDGYDDDDDDDDDVGDFIGRFPVGSFLSQLEQLARHA